MRGAIEWSYNLLSDDERALFRRLSVFAGGWSIGAVREVCSDSIDEVDTVDLLASLVDKSLVLSEAASGSRRYRMLESLRQFALEKVIESGELDRLYKKHANFYLGFADEMAAKWEVISDENRESCIEIELDNLRAALDWTLVRGNDVTCGAKLVASLCWYWESVRPAEGRHWVRATHDLVDPEREPKLAADLLRANLGTIYPGINVTQRAAFLSASLQALELYKRIGDQRGMGSILSFYGWGLLLTNQASKARDVLAESLVLNRQFGSSRDTAWTLGFLAETHRDDPEKARALFSEALSLADASHWLFGRAVITRSYALFEYRVGNLAQAIQLERNIVESLERPRGFTAVAFFMLAHFSLAAGRYDDARTYAQSALQTARIIEEPAMIILSMAVLAIVAAHTGNVQSGARLWKFCDVRLRAMDTSGTEKSTEVWRFVDYLSRGSPAALDKELVDHFVSRLRERLDCVELDKLMAEGSALTDEQAMAEALRM
jgi:tetratricopeptide (TPR) repeat protein